MWLRGWAGHVPYLGPHDLASQDEDVCAGHGQPYRLALCPIPAFMREGTAQASFTLVLRKLLLELLLLNEPCPWDCVRTPLVPVTSL